MQVYINKKHYYTVEGILSQEPSDSVGSASPGSLSYIAASYVKWIEGQGARVVPIRFHH